MEIASNISRPDLYMNEWIQYIVYLLSLSIFQ